MQHCVCACVSMYVLMCACVYMFVLHVCVHMYVSVGGFCCDCVCMSVYMCMSVCAHLSMFLMYAFACMCINLCVCICVCVCKCLYVHVNVYPTINKALVLKVSRGQAVTQQLSQGEPVLLVLYYCQLCFFLNCIHIIMTSS